MSVIYTGFKDKNLNDVYTGHKLLCDNGIVYYVGEQADACIVTRGQLRFYIEDVNDPDNCQWMCDINDTILDDCVIIN